MPSDPAGLLRGVLRAAATAPDPDALLDRVAALLVGRLGDWVVADRLADPDLVVRVAAIGPDGPLPLQRAASPRGTDDPVDPHAAAGSSRPRRSGAGATGLLPRVQAAPHQVLRLGPADLSALAVDPDPLVSAQVALVRQLGGTAAVLLVLGRRERPLGVLTLLTGAEPLSDAAVGLARDVALLVGLALETLRLQQVQRDLSQAMQTSLLPPLPVTPGLVLAARYHPAVRGLDLGGDWYDAFPGPDGDLALVIGDAAGHDSLSAARMAELRHALRALAADRAAGPAEVLQRLDRSRRALGVDSGATCLHARLQPPSAVGARRLTWSSAGHLPPVLVHEGRAQVLERAPDLMLGVDPDTPREEHEVDLHPGDVLLLCTDGLVEDRRADLGRRLELLRSTVEAAARRHPEELADLLVAELAPDAEDDVALLVLRVADALAPPG